MSQNRRQILEMLAAGQITADEAERLIAALGGETSTAESSENSEAGSKPMPQYLRVVVESEDGLDHGHGGPAKVNVRVPMQLLRAGVKLASIIPPQARTRVNEALHEKGVVFDLNQIKPENLEELVAQLRDLTVDIDDKKNKVRVFCE